MANLRQEWDQIDCYACKPHKRCSRPVSSTQLPAKTALSVIIPAYNAAPYLKACVGSILRKAPPLEIIIVDDGSHDGTADIADELAAGDPRITVIHQENAGSAAARNVGISRARGAYLGFVDNDDEVEEGWARRLLDAGRTRRAAIIKGEIRIMEMGGILANDCRMMADNTALHWFGAFWSALYRRDFVQAHGLCFPEDIPYYSDDINFQVPALVNAILHREPIALCPSAIYRHIHRESSFDSPVLNAQKVRCAILSYERLHALFCKCSQQLPAAGVGYQYFYWIRNLSMIAKRAENPADQEAAKELAQRLIRECPTPRELEQTRREHMPHSPTPRPT